MTLYGPCLIVREFATAGERDRMVAGEKSNSAREGIAARRSTGRMCRGAARPDMDGAAFDKEATHGGGAADRAFGAVPLRTVQRHVGAVHNAPLPA